MSPDRKFVRENGDKVEEYYWGGKYVVYINNYATDKAFNDVVDEWNTKELPNGKD